MLANTLTITIDGTAHTLVRVNQDNFSSVYIKKDATQAMQLDIRQSVEGPKKASPDVAVDRHNIAFSHTVYATPTASEKYYTVTATMRSRQSSDPAWLDKITTGFITLLTAQKTAIINGEN